jgi:hypothetical protein
MPAFEPGHKKVGGRDKDTPNKRNQEIFELSEEFGISPVRVKFYLMTLQFDKLGYSKEQVAELTLQELVEIQSRNGNDLLPYYVGKRKPIDSEGNDQGDPLSDLLDAIHGK